MLGVVGMSEENGESILLRLYEWAYRKWPKYLDCRPICVERSLRDAGYEIAWNEPVFYRPFDAPYRSGLEYI